jgi:hypothetical protein
MRVYTARKQSTLDALTFIINGNQRQDDELYHLIAEQSLEILLADLFIEISLVLAASDGSLVLTDSGDCLSLSAIVGYGWTTASVANPDSAKTELTEYRWPDWYVRAETPGE